MKTRLIYRLATFTIPTLAAILAVSGSGWAQGIPYYQFDRTPRGVHHYVYEHGQLIPQWYRYDPHPNYRRFSYQFPPYYVARPLEYYEGLDKGRVQDFRPSWETLHY